MAYSVLPIAGVELETITPESLLMLQPLPQLLLVALILHQQSRWYQVIMVGLEKLAFNQKL